MSRSHVRELKRAFQQLREAGVVPFLRLPSADEHPIWMMNCHLQQRAEDVWKTLEPELTINDTYSTLQLKGSPIMAARSGSCVIFTTLEFL